MDAVLCQVGLLFEDDELDEEYHFVEVVPYKQGLKDMRFHRKACEDAIAGRQLPEYLGHKVIQLCIIRGIRYHAGFGRDLKGLTPAFTRAINAQDIMNNVIPDMPAPDDIPYCIWHPTLPNRETCRELASRYPQMKYQVGRVCAIAGYYDVYCELGLLPEIHIADEARERRNLLIYDLILSQPFKYAVFNDYERTVNDVNPPIAALNGDTLVVSQLDVKQPFRRPSRVNDHFRSDLGYDEHMMDITEDMCIDTFTSKQPETDQSIVIPLLYSPLPKDLPTVQKDLLILVAAFNGDIDRYARLRRPYMIQGERNCIVRGIYHSSTFAKWYSLQPVERMRLDYRIAAAINARFIMSNDLSRVSADTKYFEMPYNIWYPQVAYHSVYEELVLRKPEMQLQAARACIVADYQPSYQKINPPHDEALEREAAASLNPFYLDDQRQKKEAGNSTGKDYRMHGGWKMYTAKNLKSFCSTSIFSHLEPHHVRTEQEWIYDGFGANMSKVDASICASPEAKQGGLSRWRDVAEIYQGLPAGS